MTRLLMLVEGESENVFVKQILSPHLSDRAVYLADPVVLPTKRYASGGGHYGGPVTWQRTLRNLKRLLGTGAWVTMLVDFCRIGSDFPGYREARKNRNPRLGVQQLEDQIANEIHHAAFIPFVALHEFEAWIFSAPKVVAEHFGDDRIAEKIRDEIKKAGEPELIDHGPETHPKAMLRKLTGTYKETADGPTLLQKIGLATIRDRCPHFNDWLTRLEGLSAEKPAPPKKKKRKQG